MKGVKAFVDTNVMIYAYDSSAGAKHEIAGRIMSDLWTSGEGLLSTQVVHEFYVNITRKIPKPLAIDQALEIVIDLLKWDAIINDGDSIIDAIGIQQRHNISFWDAMIIGAAISGGAGILYTEDLNGGQAIGGVKIVNPFAEPT